MASLARALGLEEMSILLEETLVEEKSADQSLTRIAERSVNVAAKGVHQAPPFALI
jgi:ferritin-like metal-binding protein YciE